MDLMQLSDFFDYKNQLMKDILTSPKIVNLIDEDCRPEDATKLAYTRVFPYQFIPETVEDGVVFVCMDVDIRKVYSSTTLSPTITIWVFAHKSMLRLKEGGVRTDALCNELCEILNGSTKYGMGELEFSSVSRYAPMTDYNGKVLTFTAKEWNRTYNPKKEIPPNRKRNERV